MATSAQEVLLHSAQVEDGKANEQQQQGQQRPPPQATVVVTPGSNGVPYLPGAPGLFNGCPYQPYWPASRVPYTPGGQVYPYYYGYGRPMNPEEAACLFGFLFLFFAFFIIMTLFSAFYPSDSSNKS